MCQTHSGGGGGGLVSTKEGGYPFWHSTKLVAYLEVWRWKRCRFSDSMPHSGGGQVEVVSGFSRQGRHSLHFLKLRKRSIFLGPSEIDSSLQKT